MNYYNEAMKKTSIIAPILFAIYPVLFLYSRNTEQFPISVTFLPAIITVVFAVVAWSILAWLLGSGAKSSLVVSLFLGLMFSYGHAVTIVGNPHFYVLGIHIGHNKILIPIWTLLMVLGFWLAARSRGNLRLSAKVVTFAAACLVTLAAVDTVYSMIKGRGDSTADAVVYSAPAAAETITKKPDIYYIILDGYARGDVLKELYDYDNGEFLGSLAGRGFFVAARARTNYCQTSLSLASSLNLTYLDKLAEKLGTDAFDRVPARELMSDSAVFRFLRPYGYKFIAFDTGVEDSPQRNVDIVLSPTLALNEFQSALLANTPLPAITRGMRRYQLHRKKILYTLETLEKMSETVESDKPLFVIAHVVCPHPPFVFDRRGQPIRPARRFSINDASKFMELPGASRKEYIGGYRDQLIFLNRKVISAVDGILSNSKSPPIILIQADHGPGAYMNWSDPVKTNMTERMSILSAYYLPNCDKKDMKKLLWPGITPVNSFRVILKKYFGAKCPPLEDKSYFSTIDCPYEFIEVTDK